MFTGDHGSQENGISWPTRFEQTIAQARYATLPWNGREVLVLDEVSRLLGDSVYLPSSISLIWDRQCASEAVAELLFDLRIQLAAELARRAGYRQRFVELGLFDAWELERFLTERRRAQPWVIYFSEHGGLGDGDSEDRGSTTTVLPAGGIVPCASMRNHGVAWFRDSEGTRTTRLITARKPGREWDWDSDIGHESAHAAFSPIPLFVQGDHTLGERFSLEPIRSPDELSPCHIARILYLFVEIPVLVLRGERRDNDSGMPTDSWAELIQLFRLSHQLMPESGFDRALAAVIRAQGRGFWGNDLFDMAAVVMRVTPLIEELLETESIPTLSWFERSSSYTKRACRSVRWPT